MELLFIALVVIVACLLSFVLGALFGITDCKRKFAIPKGATGLDEYGKYTFN